jgi:hypothetical protein
MQKRHHHLPWRVTEIDWIFAVLISNARSFFETVPI